MQDESLGISCNDAINMAKAIEMPHEQARVVRRGGQKTGMRDVFYTPRKELFFSCVNRR